jgi:branched-chain amino acid transport system permease protein
MPRVVTAVLALAVAVLALYPIWGELVFGSRAGFFLQRLSGMMILAIFAMSLDLLVGITGMVSLGHALCFGLAGYTLALTTPESGPASLWWSLPFSLAVCALASLAVGALCIRTSGIFFIMVTLAFAQMAYHLASDSDFTGGSDGLFFGAKPTLEVGGVTLLRLGDKLSFYYVTLTGMVAVYALLRTLVCSPFGRVLAGIRSNEQRARALGYDANFYKLLSFVIAGTLAGLAGYLAAAQYGFVNPSGLGWHSSGNVLMMTILGGMGTLFGPALGAFVFEILHYLFEDLTRHWLLLMGAVTIAVAMYLPHGLAGLLLRMLAPSARANPERGDE